MLKINPIVRLAIGVTLLSISLVLLFDLLGLMPNKQKAELQTRKVLTELLAVQVSDSIESGNLEAVNDNFITIKERYREIESLGLRVADGTLMFAAGESAAKWPDLSRQSSTYRYVKVPILRDGETWAVLEVTFSTNKSTLYGFLTSQKTVVVVVLLGIFGLLINWLFLRRALRELDPKAVVPERVTTALNVLSEGLVMLDRGGRIVLCNKAFQQKTRKDASALVGYYLSDLQWVKASDSQDSDAVLPWTRLLDSGVVDEQCQLSFTTDAGDTLQFDINITLISTQDGVVKGAVVTFDDVTELASKNNDLKRLVDELKLSQREISIKNRELEILATRDPLTGSLNRRSLFEGMESLQAANRENGELLSCIMVDIDHFKSINDNYGHSVGDDVIAMLARVLTDIADSVCLVGRYGGEEFVVAFPGFTEERAAEVAEEMRLAIYQGTYAKAGMPSPISASFGVAEDKTGLMTPGELIDLADQGLYQAKESGRNQVVRYSLLGSGITQGGNSDEIRSGNDEQTGSNSHQKSVPAVTTEDTDNSLEKSASDASQANSGDNANQPVSNPVAERDRTQLPSTIVMQDRILQGIRRSARQKTHFAVMAIEVDALELINNTEGSMEADRLVNQLTSRLEKLLRSTDTVAIDESARQGTINVSRAGISDILIMLSDILDANSITWITRRISEELQSPFDVGLNSVSLDARIGVSVYPGDGDDPATLIANARQALREARKSSERSACFYFDHQINDLAVRALRLESDLRFAIERNELSLVYQPLVELSTGRVVGFESLTRWQNAHFGNVSPAQFIPIAEQSGAIDSIGRWVIEQSAFQLKQWQNVGHTSLYMSINVSVAQFRFPGFLDHIRLTLDKLNLQPNSITLEITETALIHDYEQTAGIINQLQRYGFRIALDDFGTGYSSLAYLKKFPIDTVKIDKSYFTEFPGNVHDTSLIKAIISLSRSLGLSIVAEGVETPLQLDVLMHMHCDLVQGYVFSEPLSRDQAGLLLVDSQEIRQKTNTARRHSSSKNSPRSNAITGVLNDIEPNDVAALSQAANRSRWAIDRKRNGL